MAQNANAAWTEPHTQYVLDHINDSNEDIATVLGRSPWAVQWKRAHLAAKLHAEYPQLTIEACASRTHADPTQTIEAVRSKKAKDSSLGALLRPSQQGGARVNHDAQAFQTQPVAKSIELICEAITREEGKLSALFHDEAMLPLIIQYYPGFQAYAMHVRGL